MVCGRYGHFLCPIWSHICRYGSGRYEIEILTLTSFCIYIREFTHSNILHVIRTNQGARGVSHGPVFLGPTKSRPKPSGCPDTVLTPPGCRPGRSRFESLHDRPDTISSPRSCIVTIGWLLELFNSTALRT